jgi:hypothetical protein
MTMYSDDRLRRSTMSERVDAGTESAVSAMVGEDLLGDGDAPRAAGVEARRRSAAAPGC